MTSNSFKSDNDSLFENNRPQPFQQQQIQRLNPGTNNKFRQKNDSPEFLESNDGPQINQSPNLNKNYKISNHSSRNNSPPNSRRSPSRQGSPCVTNNRINPVENEVEKEKIVHKKTKSAKQKWDWAVKKINKKESPTVS